MLSVIKGLVNCFGGWGYVIDFWYLRLFRVIRVFDFLKLVRFNGLDFNIVRGWFLSFRNSGNINFSLWFYKVYGDFLKLIIRSLYVG